MIRFGSAPFLGCTAAVRSLAVRSLAMRSLAMRSLAVPVLAVLLLAVVSCRPSIPFDDDGVHVRRGGDMLAARGSVVIEDTVAGDVMAAGADIRFFGVAGGDLLVAGANQRLAGTAAGSIRAAGADIRVATEVGRNVTLAGANVVLEHGGRVAGNAYLTGATVRMDGAVDRLLRVVAREAELNGTVAGDVLVEARDLRVGPNAVIEGGLRYRVERGREAVIDPGARIDGGIVTLEPRPRLWIRGALRWLALIGFLVAGAVVVALLPRVALVAESRIRARPAASVGVGILMLLVMPLVVAVMAITIVGIPLALVTAAVFGVTVYLAPVVVGVWLGRLVVPGGSYPERGVLVLAFLLGGLAVGLLGLLPYAGIGIRILAAALGLGALIVALWEGAVRVERA